MPLPALWYLLKDMEPKELCLSLQKALQGTSVLSEAVTGKLFDALSARQPPSFASRWYYASAGRYAWVSASGCR
ncbi:DNA-binding NarL/FixJ family response regulator [Paraburkholderia youngii]